jgi:glycosyltransferase involved in cell wall biosynthesis
MISVIHIITTIERGGAENHLQSLIEKQISNNYKIVVIYLKGKPYWQYFFEDKGIKVFKYKSIFQLISIIKKHKIQVVHAHLQVPEILSSITHLIFPKFKLVFSRHNDAYSRFLPKVFNPIFYQIISKRASKIICISKNVFDFCKNNLGLNKDKLQIIYYGISRETYAPSNIDDNKSKKLMKEFKLKDEFIIGTVARLHPQKSLHTLIAAFKSFSKQVPNSKLFIVGEGHLESELKSLVSNLGIIDKVIFTGKRSEIPVFYKIFNVFVLSSIYEGLGLVLLEAMAAEKPIIGTNAGAIPDIISNCGAIVETENPTAISKELIRIYKNPDLVQQMTKKGVNDIKEKFTLERMYLQTDQIYKQVLNL